MSQKVTKSYESLLILIRGINILLSDKSILNSKAGKKLQKIVQKAEPHIEEYNEKVEDIKLDNANVDDSGSLIFDEKGGYKYSKDGQKKLNSDIKDLLKKEFEFYQLSFSAEGLEDYLFLSGWVEGITAPELDSDDDFVG